MTIIDDYLAVQVKYEKLYGSRTAVLYEVGSFFEIYACDGIGDVRGIAELLNIQSTRKNKAIAEVSRSNPMLCGFPSLSLQRYMTILMNSDYTCVVVSQTTPPPDPKREVTGVFSAGTSLEAPTDFDYNNLVCFVFQEETLPGGKSLSLGAAVLDVGTGTNSVYQALASKDRGYAIEEGVRLVKTFNPREVVIVNNQSIHAASDLIEILELTGRMVHIVDKPAPAISRIAYQNDYLQEVLQLRTGLLSSVEFLNLENKPLAVLALVQLLRFVADHSAVAVQRLQKPTIMNDTRCMSLENNAVQQLNVLPTTNQGRNGSLFSILSGMCSTNLGRRRLKDRLLFPLVSPAEIKDRYDSVDAMKGRSSGPSSETKYHFEAVADLLAGMPDVERLHRRLELGTIHPYEMHALCLAYAAVQHLVRYVSEAIALDITRRLLPSPDELRAFAEVVADCEATFDMARLEKYSLTAIGESIFRPGVFSDVDEAGAEVETARLFLNGLKDALSRHLDPSGVVGVKLEASDKEGHMITTTKRRADTLMTKLRAAGEVTVVSTTIPAADISVVAGTGTTSRITCPQLRAASNRAVAGCERMKALCKARFEEVTKRLSHDREAVLGAVVRFLADCDVSKAAAHAAFKFGYTRPDVVEADSSFIEAEDVRHAIIERLQTGLAYVPNWVKLGVKPLPSDSSSDSVMDGMILFGCNSAGKSSYQKSVGLCVILAQAGLFVPAKSFRFAPFHSLMTRILGNDDLFKGQSSFATEMGELRGILSRCDQNTLVLGDEIANSTESTSGLAIVAAAVMRLAACRSKFIFASHLHPLATMIRIKNLSNVRCFHLQITYDGDTGTLCYDRRLKEGAGLASYGIEVARYVGLDDDFIALAHEIRREIMEAERCGVEARSSRYNARLFMKPCGVCGGKGVDVHHILPQKTADAADLVAEGAMHKNDLANLVVLCEACHDAVHHGELDIAGYRLTSDGRQLVVDVT